MNRDMMRDGRALRRIVALLLALADIAARAGTFPLPVRVIVLAVLRHAEAVAWTFALGTVSVPTACRRSDLRPQHMALPGASVGSHDGPADAARLILSLRALALIVASWAIRALSSAAMPSPVRRAMAPDCARPGGSWRGPGALPAPDTS